MRVWFILALLVPTLALADGFDSGRSPVAGGSGTAADGTAFVVESVPGTAASATGTDSIAIGESALSSAADAVAIGSNADATGENAVAIGGDGVASAGANATGAQSVAIGNGSDATAEATVALGDDSSASVIGGIAIGSVSAASNTASVAIGFSTTASGDRAVAIGQSALASGANCVAIGGNGAGSSDAASCTAADSAAIGQHVVANDIGEFAFASGEFATQSDAHTSIFVLRNNTTDATQTELFADGSAGDISVPSDCTVAFDVLITARQTDADDVSAGYTFFGVIDNNAGTTALVGSLGTVTTIGEDVAGWDVTATADDTNDGINILVTGAVGDAVQWVARVEVVETCG